MREEIRRFLEDGSAPPLLEHHRRHFLQRTSRLHPILLPGRDKSQSAMESLTNGAFASFAREPTYPGGRPAFRFAYEEHPTREPLLLYYWRDSATHRYLRNVADDVTRGYLNVVRNVRYGLRRGGFAVVGHYGHQPLYAPHTWSSEQKARRAAANTMNVRCDPHLRGVAAISAVFDGAECALTAVQVTSILWLSKGQALDQPNVRETSREHEESSEPEVEERLIEEEVAQRARAQFALLSDLERELLWARGYGDSHAPKKSFREVAQQLGRYVPERYRQMERAIFEVLHDHFEPDERPILARIWAELIGELHSKERP